MNLRNKILSVILCIAILFTLRPFVPTTHAWWGFGDINWDAGNFVANYGDWIANLGQYAVKIAEFAWTEKEELLKVLASEAVAVAKVLALYAVEKVTASIIGSGGGLTIRDWESYLYTTPTQTALTQMDTFYNTTSSGTLSSLNYEGVSGTTAASYLVSQAKDTISGTSLIADIQNYATNPSQDLFSGGNMQALIKSSECANNVACYTIAANKLYNDEFAKAQKIAKAEQQNGFLPVKVNGRIDKPAALISSSLMQVDKMGTDLIMTASSDGTDSSLAALTQIAEGSVLSIAARAANYGISDNNGKAAVVAQNDKYPFSLAYSALTSN